ncbi:UbiD family decarboxylase [Anaplasma bovis]|uniref:UbiD family decarboxylase n=1 Tax=Anaplasma bovis TaxID=186733 RepID=UPI002FF3C40E
MSFESLGKFVSFLKEKRDLVTIDEEVSSVLEITEIHRRVINTGGPALLFNNVSNSYGKCSMPVVTNIFGTVERIACGIGTDPSGLRKIGELLAFLKSPIPPESLKDIVGMFPILRNVISARACDVRKAKCQEIVIREDDVDLSKFPIQTCWPGDAAPLITWPIVVTKGPSTAREDNFNLGIYRMQVVDKNTTIMRWLKHRGGAQQYGRWVREKNEDFPAAVVMGTDPATMISAVTPIPDNMSEYQFAGILRKSPTELVKCITVPLKVPANAEIVLEGFVTRDLLDEGPHGDHTGYYNAVERFPKFVVKAITMRKDPLYLSTFTGRPPDECSVLGEALNEIFIPILVAHYPEIVDFWLPPEGCSYRIAVVSIKKAYPGHARKIIMGIISFLRQFLYVKFVIVVDDDICARDWKDVMWAISTRMDPRRDMMFIDGAPIDYLDFASTEEGLGGKVGLDATNKIYPETKRDWGVPMEMSKSVVDMVTAKWDKYGFGCE